MIAPGNALLSSALGILLVVVLCYAAGRLHQWYRTTYEREAAFRDGYDTATRSLFSLAARVGREITISRNAKQGFEPGIVSAAKPTKAHARGAAPVTKMSPTRRVPRHRAPDDGQTVRLPDLRDKKSA